MSGLWLLRNSSGAKAQHNLYDTLSISDSVSVVVTSYSAYKAAVLADSPLVYYRLDETSGSTAADSSGNSHNATYNNVTQNVSGATSDGNKAASFDGSTSWVGYDSAPWSTVTTGWTMEAWIYPTSWQTGANGNATGDFGCIMANGSNSGGYSFGIGGDGGATSSTLSILYNSLAWKPTTYTFPTLNTWYHVAVTLDGSANLIAYVNGSSVWTGSGTPFAPVARSDIGQCYVDGTWLRFFTGYIDEVAFYTTALSSTRIAAHYSAK